MTKNKVNTLSWKWENDTGSLYAKSKNKKDKTVDGYWICSNDPDPGYIVTGLKIAEPQSFRHIQYAISYCQFKENN